MTFDDYPDDLSDHPDHPHNRSKKHRVAEIFGPTIQGEGRLVGMPCHFVRFGGCDYRCDWCDTPHAVLPDQVAQLGKMDEWQILTRLLDIDVSEYSSIRWVVLTGGNPALRDLSYLIELLHTRSYKVMLETQGSVYRYWYKDVDDLCFSPKPPSSGMVWDFDLFDHILQSLHADKAKAPYLKVPVFTLADFDFVEKVHRRWPNLEMFISIGNEDPQLPTVGNPNPEKTWKEGQEHKATRDMVLYKFRDTVEYVLAKRPSLQDCRIFPQQHTLLWGNARGH